MPARVVPRGLACPHTTRPAPAQGLAPSRDLPGCDMVTRSLLAEVVKDKKSEIFRGVSGVVYLTDAIRCSALPQRWAT